MKDDNKQIVIERIWNDPAPVFGCDFREGTTYRPNIKGGDYDENGKIRLKRTPSGIFVYYNGGSRKSDDVFNYLMEYHLHTSDFWDTLQTCAERYGVRLELSEKQAEKIHRERLAREVAPSLAAALMEHRDGDAWHYLSDVRGIEPDAVHYGELSPESLKRAKDALKARGFEYSDDDFKALKLTPEQAARGYNLVLPYYRNGVVVGFLFRDVTGKAPHKYDTPEGMKRGYCEHLTHGEPAYIVEGEIDALRLMGAGLTNVIAMGGATMGEDIARLLNTYEIRQVTYVPDLKYNEQGEQETEVTDKAIKAFQAANVDGERVITRLYIAEFSAPEGATLSNYKIDADTYGKEHGGDALRTFVATATEWWGRELNALESWARGIMESGGEVNFNEFERRFMDIYNRCASPMERERIRQDIKGGTMQVTTPNGVIEIPIYTDCGLTPAALLDVDELRREQKRRTDYNNTIKAGLSALTRAVDDVNGINPAVVRDVLAKLNEVQGTATRDEWRDQIKATFADQLKAIQKQPETLRTKWELGEIFKNKENPAILDFHRYEYIEYYPATITVFCAPTSHGKTMILLQSALDLVRTNPEKVFLYVSCEENNRQLLERALNVFMDIPTEADGIEWDDPKKKQLAVNYCFIEGTRKRAIKYYLRGGNRYPEEYAKQYNEYCRDKGLQEWRPTNEHPTPPNWERLCQRLAVGVERYGEQIHPNLKLIHTDGSAESIAANVLYFVKQYKAQGADVCAVFVDYMQLLTSENKTTARNYELKDVCKVLSDCAAATEIPIIVAAQLNREAIRPTNNGGGLDNVTVANLGEGADIERIAHDIYFVWQVDKTHADYYQKFDKPKDEKGKTISDAEPVQVLDFTKLGTRSRRILRIVTDEKTRLQKAEPKKGYLYVEQMKARDGKTDGWGLFPFKGEQGQIGTIDTEIMKL